MPVRVTYPGVYIEEIPSGQHVITGVATSITAFVGRAVYGPTDEPITIFSYGDYERMFGGLSYNYPMSYAVRDFFLNGGTQAVIARLFQPDTEISEDQWNNKANAASKAVVTAVNQVKVTADTKPQDLAKAADDAAAAYTTDPEKSAAQAVANVADTAAKDAGAKPQDVKTAVNKLDLTTTIPPYPSPQASLALSTFTWANILDGAHGIIKAMVDSLYDGSGTKINPTTPTPNSIYKSTKQNTQRLAGVQDANVSKFARTLNLSLKAPDSNDTIEKVIGDIISEVTGGEKTFIPQSAATAVGTYSDNLVKAVDALFDPKGNLKTDANGNLTKSKQDIDTGMDAALQTLKSAVAIPASVLNLIAADPGSWGNNLTASVDYQGISDEVAQNYQKYNLGKNDLFNLNVEYTKSNGQKMIERFPTVTVVKDTKAPNRLDRVLLHQSQLVRVPVIDEDGQESPDLPDSRPPENSAGQGTGGSDGALLDPLTYIGDEDQKTGIYMLKKVDLFNLLCIPPDVRKTGDIDPAVYTEALKFCVDRRAMLIVDPPSEWADLAKTGRLSDIQPTDPELGINGTDARNAAVYFPRVIEEDLEMNGQPDIFPACGIIAGVMATTDLNRGVWKAPAGQDAAVMGIQALEVKLTDDENGILNPLGINCLRNFPIIGPVVWGARTMRGADQLADDYKYVPVRRLTLYIEESLYRGTKWAVFEPNDENLWSSLRLSVGSFLADLARQGAFYNYTVTCDSSTTTPDDIENGIVNILVQIAPVKPAEFVVIQIQQVAAKPAA